MRGIGKTDVGILRENNEDCIFVCNEQIGFLPNLFIVADGMGGHNAGEIASKKSIEFFCEYIKQNPIENNELLDFIVSGISYANKKVFEETLKNLDYAGMGTTFSTCVIVGNRLYIGHIGDSRVYIFGGGQMGQLTTDHTYVNELVMASKVTHEEAKNHPKRNLLTRALGVEHNVLADARVFAAYENDHILICSDGLTNMLNDKDIYDIVVSDLSLQAKVSMLIDVANERGGIDNISAILISMKEVIQWY